MDTFRRPAPEGMAIGSDRVLFDGNSVIIHAAREMGDWQVREFCRIPIFFRGRKFYLKRKTRLGPPFAMSYELESWPEEYQGESTLVITYSEAYVAERDRSHRDNRRDEIQRLVLLAIYPFLGLLWSDFKDRRLERFGLNSRSITEGSLIVLMAFAVCECVFLFVFHSGFLETAYGFQGSWLDFILFVTCTADVVVRANQLLRDEEHPDGFLEWLVKLMTRFVARLRR